MYDYFKGKITEINPSFLILETGGIGYFINISLNAYNTLSSSAENMDLLTVYIHQLIREDAITLYGFTEPKEREVFRQLISVSGVGANTARLILSSLTTQETIHAITSGDVNTLKGVKGIGAKSAQRIIVDLKDKINQTDEQEEHQLISAPNNRIENEALSALVTLGFARASAEKVIQAVLKQDETISIEGLVKACLKRL